MATLDDLRYRVLRLLSDPTGEKYEAALILDAIGAAHDAILPWVPKTAKASLTGDGTKVIFDLPTDLYEIEACVVNSSGENLPMALLSPGHTVGSNIAGTNDWLEYPAGQISFSKALSGGEVYDLYYLATWDKPDETWSGSTPLEPPGFVTVGLSLYAAAYAILPSAVAIGEVRQYGTKIDSGNPEHNPLQKAADYLLKLFAVEMGRHPKHQRTQR